MVKKARTLIATCIIFPVVFTNAMANNNSICGNPQIEAHSVGKGIVISFEEFHPLELVSGGPCDMKVTCTYSLRMNSGKRAKDLLRELEITDFCSSVETESRPFQNNQKGGTRDQSSLITLSANHALIQILKVQSVVLKPAYFSAHLKDGTHQTSATIGETSFSLTVTER
ncbi:MAG: hypothetical protein AAF429_05410 [Pseudomonadota bacterium]